MSGRRRKSIKGADDEQHTSPPSSLKGKHKATPGGHNEAGGKRSFRSCEKSRCPAKRPICFARSERCAGDGYTSRWYHLSAGEHFCNECFDFYYRSHRDGYHRMALWKREWSSYGKTEANLKTYMVDAVMPYWVQCTMTDCRKWRILPNDVQLTTDFIQKYCCGMMQDGTQPINNDACKEMEDHRVEETNADNWLSLLMNPPLLKNSPAAPYLQEYYPDGVGLSATCKVATMGVRGGLPDDHIDGLHPYFQPFYQPEENGKALCVRPDVMEYDEVQEFPEFAREQQMYLALRNLALALWNTNYKEVLTVEKCVAHLIVRGLVRVACVRYLKVILAFLTIKGLVNTGLLKDTNSAIKEIVENAVKLESVLIIGAGPSGLSAGRQLQNFGADVTILEAQDRIGGRVWDDTNLGVCVGKGAQIVNGCINNPIALMCEQAGIKMRKMHIRCDLVEEDGSVTDITIDKRVDFHFNAMLDAIAEWKRDNENQLDDLSLAKKLQEMHETFVEETSLKFSAKEERLFQFHISNLEYACGCDLSKVSSLHWDQNENFAQFAGDHTLIEDGYMAVLNKLADGLDIRLNTEVTSIDYRGKQVIVQTKNGKEYKAQKVLVTVPLAILQRKKIAFKPPLPAKKQAAINCLGAGIIEKIGLQFPSRFWSKKVIATDYFGHIPPEVDKRGMFSVFYDMTPPRSYENEHVLMTVVSGEAVQFVQSKTDKEVIEECMKCLRSMFPDEDVPDPSNSFVTHWHKNPHALMAYSYIGIGASGEAYEIIAESVNNKVFFAGEASNRHFPQTVTGAYLSGIREAAKILS
ncbi:lysine-specific histone demethylase 1B-like [Anneissia japonica]|uniref:lysine-specific histone demethylase 1B-like n=1 Tax=Anneissia japonica TaxID=1529436 RepID=UPI0014257493|nr:lysine-specific histone demethylase 1B-like [Anneissia japonica]XP_033123360.1 lysine-specific histone demethylase 1B-like [Anneissia japonica]